MLYPLRTLQTGQARHFVATLLTLTLAACADAGGKRMLSGAVSVVEVHRSNVCGTEGAATKISFFPDAAALQAWQATHHVEAFDGPIAQGETALIELGERSTEGYDILVSRQAQLRDGTLKLTATFLTPPAQVPADMPSPGASIATPNSPCVLIALPKIELRALVLLDPSGVERARTHVAMAATPSAAPAMPPAPELAPSPANAPEAAAAPKPDETVPTATAPEAPPAPTTAPPGSAPPMQSSGQ